MTAEREAHLIAQVGTITSTAELDAFRAQLRAQGDETASGLFMAMEQAADRLRGRK